MFLFFFFKQKTAYEVRISDWSSDVCSSDLAELDPKDPASYPNACSGAFSPSGTNLDGCEAIHAEQNALLQCKDVREIHTCYCTASPCVTCTKLLLNTGCMRVVFMEEYPHPAARDLWTRAGREWVQLVKR